VRARSHDVVTPNARSSGPTIPRRHGRPAGDGSGPDGRSTHKDTPRIIRRPGAPVRAALRAVRAGVLVALTTTVALTWSGAAVGNAAREDATDADTLVLSGGFEAPAGGRTLPGAPAELAALPGYGTLRAQLLPHEPAVTLGVLPLAALVRSYPLSGGADGLALTTLNRWESYVTLDHLDTHGSVLLLYYDGESPASGNWPAWGGDVEPLAPFYVFDPDRPIPSFETSPRYGMIAATQITGIRAERTAERYAALESLDLSARAAEGRGLFLKRCNTCHQGPAGAGGNSSNRPFTILTTLATHSPEYFVKLVTHPKTFYPETSMPPHPDFDAGSFEALIAFLREAGLERPSPDGAR